MITFNPATPPPQMAYNHNTASLKEAIARANDALDSNPGLVNHLVADYKGWINSKKKSLSFPTRTLNTLSVSGNPCFFAALVLGALIKGAKKPYVWDATQPWLNFICKGYGEVTGKRMLSSSVRLTAWALGAPEPELVDRHFKPKTPQKEEPVMFDNQVENSWVGQDPLTHPDRTLFDRAVEAQKWAQNFKKENSAACDDLLKAYKAHIQGKSLPRKLAESLGDMRRKPSRFCCLLLSMLDPNTDFAACDFVSLYAKIFGHELNHTQLMMCARVMNWRKPNSKRVSKTTPTLPVLPSVADPVTQPEPILPPVTAVPPVSTEPEEAITGNCESPSPEIFIPANKGCSIRVTQSEGTIEITISFK